MATSTFVTSTGMVPSGTGTITGLITTSIPTIRPPSQLSSFLLYLLVGEFCFITCPFQPPSMRPISFIFSDNSIYFLLSKDLVSQRSNENIFKPSVFLIASFIYGNFSKPTEKEAPEIASIVSLSKISIFIPKV